ncbi:hypothetical protein J2128_000821 [Methanomicrobium sp. W14]|uniref:hypothetical protein n=1 Tax=Methanomicrobium sp. W14 TaxID=2817839 RepID=UPI001AE586FD|nr:hypothetical protein [Methanomicrobium sp. W14]MBP2132900.1 hypothetical protein [Methanomicrobium sp. W14]
MSSNTNLFRQAGFAAVIVLFFISAVFTADAADNLSVSGSASPEGSLVSGDIVSCNYTVDYDFESDDDYLEFYTDLIDPTWKFIISIDGTEQEKSKLTGRYETISGFELYYPKAYNTYVRVILKGTVPSVASTATYNVLEVSQYNGIGELESSAEIHKIFLNPSDLSSIQSETETKLSSLKAEIDNLESNGVYTSSAEELYSKARTMVKTAKNSSLSKQNDLLSSAASYITEAETLLDIFWTESSLNTAQIKTGSLDSIITYFDSQSSVSGDSRLVVVKSCNDNAKTLLVLAREKSSDSDNSSARDYADQSESKANEAYSYAVEINDDLGLNAPVDDDIWKSSPGTSMPSPSVSPSVTVTATATSSSGILSSVNLSDVGIGTGDSDDLDSLLHSEVNLGSFLKIIDKVYDLLVEAFDYISGLISSVSNS